MAFYNPGERKKRPGIYISITNRAPSAARTTRGSGNGGAEIVGTLTLSAEGVLIYSGEAPVLTEGVLAYTPTPTLTEDGVLAIG